MDPRSILARAPGILHDNGYATAYFGKYHMGEDNDSPRPGFDWFVTHKGQGKYFDTEWNINGRRELIKGYYTTTITEHAEKWLRAKHDKPFVAVIGQVEGLPEGFHDKSTPTAPWEVDESILLAG